MKQVPQRQTEVIDWLDAISDDQSVSEQVKHAVRKAANYIEDASVAHHRKVESLEARLAECEKERDHIGQRLTHCLQVITAFHRVLEYEREWVGKTIDTIRKEEATEMLQRILAERDQLRSDCALLAAEVRTWRDEDTIQYGEWYGDDESFTDALVRVSDARDAAVKATDSAQVLSRYRAP